MGCGADRALTGATVIGSYETIRLMAEHGVPESQLQPVSGGERIRLSDNVVVSVYPSLHSCVWTGPFQQPDVECLGDVGLTLDQQKSRFRGKPSTHRDAFSRSVGARSAGPPRRPR